LDLVIAVRLHLLGAVEFRVVMPAVTGKLESHLALGPDVVVLGQFAPQPLPKAFYSVTGEQQGLGVVHAFSSCGAVRQRPGIDRSVRGSAEFRRAVAR